MRTNLENLDGLRDWFTAAFERKGNRRLRCHLDWETKNREREIAKTVLFVDVQHKNVVLADHLWVHWTTGFENLQLQFGDVITFLATVKTYRKGLKKDIFDYKLVNVVWPQHLTLDPQPLPVLSIPKTQLEAQSMLNSFGYWSSEDKEREIRISEWKPELLENLVLEGWCEMNPGNFYYWEKQSPAFKQLAEGLRHDRNIMRYCELASLINGATVEMFSQEAWGETRRSNRNATQALELAPTKRVPH